MNERGLRFAGTWGAALTLAVVGASALLRLATAVDPAGGVVSTLPAGIESAVRLAHRACASGVALLGLAAAYFAATRRPVSRARIFALVAIAVLTLALAAIGRHTPGYRLASVTAANVACGIALAGAFWWLRLDAGVRPGGQGSRLAALIAIAVIAQSALGAGASAAAMHGARSLDPLHVASGLVLLGLVVGCAARRVAASGALAAIVACTAVLQLVLGMLLASTADRQVSAEWTHALLAGILVLALASLARGRVGPTLAGWPGRSPAARGHPGPAPATPTPIRPRAAS